MKISTILLFVFFINIYLAVAQYSNPVNVQAANFDSKLEDALSYLNSVCGDNGVKRVVVLRDNEIVYKGSESGVKQRVWSCTKSFVSTVLGLLIDEGKCKLDDKVCDILPVMKQSYPDVTFRHFATMTSGYKAVGDDIAPGDGQSSTPYDPFSVPMFAPGMDYKYWDSAMNMLALALTKLAGEPLDSYFNRKVGIKIGMNPQKWEWRNFSEYQGVPIRSGAGNYGGIYITAEEMARFGQLFLQKGRWGTEQVISETWVDQATTSQVTSVTNGARTNPYGFNWWTKEYWPDAPEGTFAARGKNNNVCLVIPAWNLVITRLGLDGPLAADKWNNFIKILGESFQSVLQESIKEKNLSYAEGGPTVEYPDPLGNPVRYVDAVNGNDTWEGSLEKPWKTLNKTITSLKALPAGTHILLRRGCIWNEVWQTDHVRGAEGKRYVLGAYGPLNEPKPRVNNTVRIRYCSFWMVRDIEVVGGQLLYFATNNSIFFKNDVHGWSSSGIAVHGGTYQIAVVENLIYDGDHNDPISIHDSGSYTNPDERNIKNGYWAVDNIVIANSGLEECIDVAGNGWREGIEYPKDVKIINNRLQCRAVPPSTRSGVCSRPFNLAHNNKYVWVIGNIGTSGSNGGIFNSDYSEFEPVLDYFQFSSNIMYNNTKQEFHTTTANSTFKYNTLLGNPSRPVIMFATNARNIEFKGNLIDGPGGIFGFDAGVPMPEIDYNWYSPNKPTQNIASDQHSKAGAIPGVEVPFPSVYNNNPYNWYNPDFLDNFIPEATWEGFAMEIVPGAFLADGTRQGMEIKPFPGLENDGYGWEGPLLIQARYPITKNATGLNNVGKENTTLGQNYPNPVRDVTTIPYNVERESYIDLSVYNISGQKVKTLVNEKKNVGTETVSWDTRDSNNQILPGGIYFYILNVDGQSESVRKMVVVR